jgi:hypothetical protein
MSNEPYSDEEAERRMREAVKRALSMPPKPAKAITGRNRKAAASKVVKKPQQKP